MSKLDTVYAAREKLLTKGWTQGTLSASDGRVCLLGAFCFASNDRISVIIADLQDLVGGPIITWNDAPGRTFNEVMEVMDELALRVKEEV